MESREDMIKINDRKALIERAKYLMDKYLYDSFTALIIAEQQLIEEIEHEGDVDNE